VATRTTMATLHPIRKAHQEHSVPWFWPLTAAIELGEATFRSSEWRTGCRAALLVGTPRSAIVTRMTPGGHIGLFMGSKTLAEAWPAIGHWMKSHEHD
jgi:hypothetical protein